METSEQAYRNFQHHVDRLCFLIDFLERKIDTGFVESTANQVVSKRVRKEAADAMDAARCTPPFTDSHQSS